MASTKAKKKANNEGCIYRRGNRWAASFYYIDKATGQRKHPAKSFKLKSEASAWLRKSLAERDAGTYVEPSKMLVSEWLDYWLEVYCRQKAPSTVSGYKSKIETRIKPYIGSIQLGKLSRAKLTQWIDDLQTAGLSAKTISNCHSIVHAALEEAVDLGHIAANPAYHLRNKPKVIHAETVTIMDDKIGEFLKAIQGDRFESLYYVALFTGLRFSELLGLSWQDVDLDRRILTVRRQLQKDYASSGYIAIDRTKSGKVRTVALSAMIVDVFRNQAEKQSTWAKTADNLWNNELNLVFTNELGEHLAHQTIYHHYKKIVTSIGVPEARFHDLRHSYATLMAQLGVPQRATQEQLGHSSPTITANIYQSVSNTMLDMTRTALDAYITSLSTDQAVNAD